VIIDATNRFSKRIRAVTLVFDHELGRKDKERKPTTKDTIIITSDNASRYRADLKV